MAVALTFEDGELLGGSACGTLGREACHSQGLLFLGLQVRTSERGMIAGHSYMDPQLGMRRTVAISAMMRSSCRSGS